MNGIACGDAPLRLPVPYGRDRVCVLCGSLDPAPPSLDGTGRGCEDNLSALYIAFNAACSRYVYRGLSLWDLSSCILPPL